MFDIHQIIPNDIALMSAVRNFFGEAFNDRASYTSMPPSPDYLRRLLGGDSFIALAALRDGAVLGAVAAYELHKFEQERSEIYIYDLAVAQAHRRQGIATALLDALKRIAAQRGAYVMFVQADTAIEDQPAIALSKLGTRENALHFDIAVK